MRRRRVLTAQDFLLLMTVGQGGMAPPSLGGWVAALNKTLRREGLHHRFSQSAVAFLQKCLDFVLQQKIGRGRLRSSLLQPFRRILLFDSTAWDVAPALSRVWPGSGGTASKANCKLQTAYEYRSGTLNFFEIQPGTASDNAYTAHLADHLQPRDLALFDLGYFRLRTFQQIASRGAFFLSRFLIGTQLFAAAAPQPLDLVALLKKYPADLLQIPVDLGRTHRLRCRLVCLRVSPQIANQRRRKLHQRSRKRHTRPSPLHLALADWTLMITNVPEAQLPAEALRPLYCLRWQIELLFKQLKSVLGIHRSLTAKEHRRRCEIYGKLILAVLIHRVHADFHIRLWNRRRRELSFEKLYKRFQERAFVLLDRLRLSLSRATAYLKEEIPRLIKTCLKLPQPSRPSTLENLESGLLKLEKSTMLNAA